ncbi:hypothetical protein MQE36_14700 [Zhouia spongiae]|uniref:Uncharacterized protein n=1 Tax=Zhouia spongiae TaxID=2202721 RepID=A0ABY3YKG8_9FLAO|nr:hypothetical protein [Zhouia spongiae]UNY98322.1 hypothetical protein MQE36_14700 [Zhouia spongiae]
MKSFENISPASAINSQSKKENASGIKSKSLCNSVVEKAAIKMFQL